MEIDKLQENMDLTWQVEIFLCKEVLIKEYRDDIGFHERP